MGKVKQDGVVGRGQWACILKPQLSFSDLINPTLFTEIQALCEASLILVKHHSYCPQGAYRQVQEHHKSHRVNIRLGGTRTAAGRQVGSLQLILHPRGDVLVPERTAEQGRGDINTQLSCPNAASCVHKLILERIRAKVAQPLQPAQFPLPGRVSASAVSVSPGHPCSGPCGPCLCCDTLRQAINVFFQGL